jgi:hypothetical protein
MPAYRAIHPLIFASTPRYFYDPAHVAEEGGQVSSQEVVLCQTVSAEAAYFLSAIAVGLGATVLMDLWALLLKQVFNIPLASYCLVGRWFRHMPEGTLMHASIANASPKRFECTVGWIAHYVIGAVYALALVMLVSGNWLAQPTLLPALLFGVGTVLVPFLLMHPSFGLGIAASRTPNPAQARLRSLMAHTAFGVGLYVCAVGMSYLVPVA